MHEGRTDGGYAVFGSFQKGRGVFKSLGRSRVIAEVTTRRKGWQARLSKAIDELCGVRKQS